MTQNRHDQMWDAVTPFLFLRFCGNEGLGLFLHPIGFPLHKIAQEFLRNN